MLDIGAAILERGKIEQTWGMQGRDLMSERNAPEDVLTQHAHQAKMDGLGVCPYVHSLRDPRYRLAVSLKASGMPTLSSMTASTRVRFLDARLQISGRSPHIRAAIGPQANPRPAAPCATDLAFSPGQRDEDIFALVRSALLGAAS